MQVKSVASSCSARSDERLRPAIASATRCTVQRHPRPTGINKFAQIVEIDGAKHFPHLRSIDRPAPWAMAWSNNDQGVAHRPGSQARKELETLAGQKATPSDLRISEDAHRSLAATSVSRLNWRQRGQHGDQRIFGVSRGEDELHMLRRLFKRLQHCIEGRVGKQNFCRSRDPVASAGRRVYRVFEQLPHFIDTRVRCGIDFKQIDKPSCIDFATGCTATTRGRRDAGFCSLGRECAQSSFCPHLASRKNR